MSKSVSPELEWFHLFERTPDLVCIASKDGYFHNINQAVVDKLGYTREELMAKPIMTFLHPDDLEETVRTRKELLKGKDLINFDNRYITKSGKIIWLNWTSVYLPEKEIVFALAKDVTWRKATELDTREKYEQFRTLTSHFKASMEKDKKFLAAELHEQLAQLASAIKIDLNWLDDNLPAVDDKVRDRLAHASAITKMLIDGIRKMSYDLSPGMIEDLGLNVSLKWLSQEFTKHHGVECAFDSSYDDAELTTETQLDLYRICQELLKSVAAQTGIKTTAVKIESDGREICLSVTWHSQKSGKDSRREPVLTGISERAASINGRLTVSKGGSNKIQVCVNVPVNSMSENT